MPIVPRFEVRDLATPALRSILLQLQPGQRRMILGRLGRKLESLLKAHFVKRDAEGNKQDFPSTHFWAREVRANTALRSYDDEKAIVGIASAAFRQKLYGGIIKPGPGKEFLAIPTRAESYGTRPSAHLIPGLFCVRSQGRAWLAVREGKSLRVYFRLVPEVNQKEDPKALPDVTAIQTALEAMAKSEVDRVLQQAKQA